MASANTANTSKVSLIVSQQVPEFVRVDHPKFVTFLEKYYEFMEQYMGTSDLPGPLSASKRLLDYRDPDFTDFDLFLDSIRKEFSPTMASELANSTANRRTFYKHLKKFYQAKGTEDSFKILFQLLYGEDIELYYPKDDMLVASGGNWVSQKKMFVVSSSNTSILENRIITGATSGATAVVERVENLPTKPYASNSALYDVAYLGKEEVSKTALYLNTDSMVGTFQIHEKVYTGTLDGKTNVVTTVLPIVSNVVFFDDFSTYANTWNMIALDDNRGKLSNLSFNVPWGPAGEFANVQTVPSDLIGNTGPWYNSEQANGELQIVLEENVSGGVVLQTGNNHLPGTWSAVGDFDGVRLYHNKNIPFDPTKLYRLSVRARDFAKHGNTDVTAYSGGDWDEYYPDSGSESARRTINYWGVSGVQSDGIGQAGYAAKFGAAAGRVVGQVDTDGVETDKYWNGSHYNLLTNSPLFPEWFVFESYIQGKGGQGEAVSYQSTGGAERTVFSDYGKNVQTAAQYWSIDNPAKLNYYAAYMRPLIITNYHGGGDVTQIDYVKIEEVSATSDLIGEYVGETGKLSTQSAYLQDNWYRQVYAYEIRSQKELAQYKNIVKESIHPVGIRMFGNKFQHSETTISSNIDSNANNQDTFAPDQLDSLASWWKADAITSDNLEVDSNVVGGNVEGTFETSNWMPPGYSNHEGDSFKEMYVSTGSVELEVEISYEDHVFGSKSLKAYKPYTPSTHGYFSWKGDVYENSANQANFIATIPPRKKWIFSAFVKTDCNDHAGIGSAGRYARFFMHTGNSYGAHLGYDTPNAGEVTNLAMPTANNEWQRISGTELLDFSTSDDTKANIRMSILGEAGTQGDPDDVGKANITSFMDGMMLEEYDESIHGTSPPWNLSPYTLPSWNGCNVMSWNDCSPNQHHLTANYHGISAGGIGSSYFGGSTDMYNARPPKYIANAVNGYPAVSFQGPIVNAASWTLATDSEKEGTGRRHPANTYRWSSDPVDTVSGGVLISDISIAANTLPRPVSNSWTIMVVTKGNLSQNTINHTTDSTIFAGGNHAGSIPANNGGIELRMNRATTRNGYLNTFTKDQSGEKRSVYGRSNTALGWTGTNNEYAANTEEWNIFGYSEYAQNGAATGIESLNFHFNGFHWRDDEIYYISFENNPGNHPGNTNFTFDGLYSSSNSNYNSMVSTLGGRRHHDDQGFIGTLSEPYDGQIAEVLLFNEKLANNQIEKIEGYLAHKYGLTDKLVHRNGDTTTDDHPYKTTKPPAIGD